jgi:hypothetical protein
MRLIQPIWKKWDIPPAQSTSCQKLGSILLAKNIALTMMFYKMLNGNLLGEEINGTLLVVAEVSQIKLVSLILIM